MNIHDHHVIEDRGHDTPCWIWTGAVTSAGYGTLRVDGRLTLAHRHSYELHIGPIPDRHTIDHLCRQTRCVNPAHLDAVTQRVNVRRGRHTKLTHDVVDTIRRRVAAGESRTIIARQLGIADVTVGRAVRGVTWA